MLRQAPIHGSISKKNRKGVGNITKYVKRNNKPIPT